MTPVIQYQPYLLLAIELDAEWSKKRSFDNKAMDANIDPLQSVQNSFGAVCGAYKEGMDKITADYHEAINEEYKNSHSFLYRPLFCLPSGHADCMAFVLVDDFDAVHHIAANARAIEEVTLAYCPTVDSLGLQRFNFVVDVEEHFSNPCRPLNFLTSLKLDGVCSLEYGLLFKRAVFRAIVSKVDTCLSWFKRDNAGSAFEVDKDDFVISLLSLQGQEEIGIIYSGQNASLAAAIGSAARSLRFIDLFPEHGDDPQTAFLKDLLFCETKERSPGQNNYRPGDLHLELFRSREGSKTAQSAVPEIPIFRWSKSILGFRFPDGERLPLQGAVSLEVQFQLAAGYRADLTRFAHEPRSLIPIPDNWTLAEIGECDVRYGVGSIRRLISLGDAFKILLDNVSDIVRLNMENRHPGIVGMQSVFSVPIPNEGPIFPSVFAEESPLDQLLFKIGGLASQGHPISEDLSLSALQTIPRTYGLPRALRRSIECLFQNFIIAVTNPNLYDLVIDLYDAFNTLHRVLTKLLPATLTEENTNNSHSRLIGPQRVRALARFATSLKNAVDKRLDLAYPDGTVRKMSVQFPGNFAQILFASDAPLKAGLGILKYHLPSEGVEIKSTESVPLRLSPLHTVGVVADTTLDPGIQVNDLAWESLATKTRQPSARLTFLQLDLDHLFNAGSYYDYMHEAFHLVYDELLSRRNHPIGAEIAKMLSFEPNVTRERIEETFVHTACFLYFAPSKAITLLHYLVGKYALDIRSLGSTRRQTLRLFAERLLRMMIPAWLVDSGAHNDFQGNGQQEYTLEKFSCFFRAQLDSIFVLFPETSTFHSEEDKQTVRDAFMEHAHLFWEHCRLDFYLSGIWRISCEIYKKLCNDHHGFRQGERQCAAADVSKSDEGWALCRLDSEAYIDSVTGTALLLGRYLTRHGIASADSLYPRQQLDRNAKRDIVFTKGRFYGDFLISRGSAQRFAINPNARGLRLRNQIAMMETFWDFSSHFRARRVMDLLVRCNLTSHNELEEAVL